MRDATIDFVIERGSTEVFRRNNLANSGTYKFDTLFLENVSEGGNPFMKLKVKSMKFGFMQLIIMKVRIAMLRMNIAYKIINLPLMRLK